MKGSDWAVAALGDVLTVRHGWPFKSGSFSTELTGRPIVVNIGNFRYSGGFRFDSTELKEYRAEYPREFELRPGDILLVMTCQTPGGEILGIPARVPDDGRTYLHNQRMGKVVVANPEAVSDDFLYWVFLWSEFNRHLVATATGTKILHTAPARIESFRLELPPVDEQRAIADALRTLDDKIELNRRMNQTLEAMARAVFRSWFVDFDPVVAKAEGRQPFAMDAETAALFPNGFVESELGPIPDGWAVRPLDEIADFLNGLALQNYPPKGERSLPVIKIAQLRRNSAEGAERAGAEIPDEYVIHDGDVVFSWSGSLMVSVWCGGPGALNQHLFKVTSREFPKWFYLEWVTHHLPEFQGIAADKATTMGHIRRHHLHEAQAVVPPKPLVDAVDRFVGPLLDQRIQGSIESRVLAELRDTLLPKLLSGEIRIRDAEEKVEAAL